MTRDEIIEHYTNLLEDREKQSRNFIMIDGVLVKDSLADLFESVIRELKQPKHDAETGLMLGIETPSQQLANFKKDERTAADALIAGPKRSIKRVR